MEFEDGIVGGFERPLDMSMLRGCIDEIAPGNELASVW